MLVTIIVFLLGFIFVTLAFGGAKIDSNIKNSIFVSIGTSLIAGSIVSALDIWRVMEQDELRDGIENIIVSAGIIRVYKKRDLDRYDSLINDMKDSIDITGYSIRGFFQSYKTQIVNIIKKYPKFKIRILLVDPRTACSREKEIEENHSYNGIFKASVITVLEFFKEYLLKEDYSNVEIRCIPHQLSTMIFRIDKSMFIGPYLYKKDSKSTVTYELEDGGWMFTNYQNEFDNLWKDAVNLTLEDLTNAKP